MSDDNQGQSIDFSSKFALVKQKEKRSKRIYEVMCEIATEIVAPSKKKKKDDAELTVAPKQGLLIAYGKFDRNNNVVDGMVQMKSVKSEQDVICWIQDEKIKEYLISKSENADGAIIVNHDGLVLASNIYLRVDYPTVELEEETATRHLTAMSFSKRDDVIATFTLSEETSKVRMYVDGKRQELFDPTIPIIDSELIK